MIAMQKIFKGMDTGGNPIVDIRCDCNRCKESTSPCLDSLLERDELKRNRIRRSFYLKGGS